MSRLIKKWHWSLKIILVVFLILNTGNTKAGIWYVSKSGNDTLNGQFPVFTSGYDGPKLTINAALALASPGDTVQISNGVYAESVTIQNDYFFNVDSVVISSLTMDAAGSFLYVFGDTLEIHDTLNLIDGILEPQASGVFVYCPAVCEVLGGNSKSFVQGRLHRQLSNGFGSLSFPIGTALDYRPGILHYSQGVPDNRIHWMQVFKGQVPLSDTLPGGLRNLSFVHYWQMDRIGAGQSTFYIMELQYDSVTSDDQVYEPLALRLVHSKGTGGWQDMGGSGSAPRMGTIMASLGSDTTGIFSIANAGSGYNPLGNHIPFASFKHSGVCQGAAFTFTDLSKNLPPSAIKSWFWDFGDNALTTDTSSLKNPVFNFPNAGTFKVKLIVTNDSLFKDSAEMNVVVKPLPKVYIENGPACFGQSSRFKDTSWVSLPDTIQTRFWHLGDGSTSTGKVISYPYGVAGNFNVKLIITTSSGCQDSTTAVAVVNKKPKPDFTMNTVCIGETSNLRRVRSLDPPESDLTYWWYDNYVFKKSDTAYNAVLVGAGDHTISLVAITNKGCRDSAVYSYTVNGKPSLSFQLDNTIANNDSIQCFSTNKFTLKPKVSAGQGQSVLASWKWGDGVASALSDSVHSYLSQGNFIVTLSAVTSIGCRDSFKRTYVVRGLVQPNFGKTGVCTPDSIVFFDSATNSSSAISSRKWVFPAGVTATGSSTKQWIKQTGPVDVKYIVTNSEGCSDSVTRSFTFTAYPVVSFLVSGSLPFCPGDSITVKADGGLNMRWWVDNDTNRTKVLYTAGNYKVRAFNSPFCYADDSFLVVVYPNAAIYAGRDTTIYRGDKAFLTASGGNTYTWSPATTLNQTFGPKVTASPVDTQAYVVVGQTINGCVGQDTVIVFVKDRNFIRIPNLITPNGDGENDFWVLSDVKDLNLFDITIVDYAGKIVYQNSNYQNDWNAVMDGKELPEGIYYYRMASRNSTAVYKGFIQVIR